MESKEAAELGEGSKLWCFINLPETQLSLVSSSEVALKLAASQPL
jgi:hypothetical protein